MTNFANRGKLFEKHIESLFYGCAKLGKPMMLIRTPPEMRIIRSIGKGQFMCTFSGKGPPDYVVNIGGKAYIADAKETKDTKLPYQNIKEHQATAFEEWDSVCGEPRSFLFVRFKSPFMDYMIPWASIREGYWAWRTNYAKGIKAKRGEGSFPQSKASSCGIPLTMGGIANRIGQSNIFIDSAET